MEHMTTIAIPLIIGSSGLFLLYQAIKNWKLLLSYLLMPLAGMLVTALIMAASQFNGAVHPVLLGMAGVGIGGLTGHWLALRNNWV